MLSLVKFVVIPKLNVNMTCEVSERAKEMVEMEVDVRLKHVSNKTIKHAGPCIQLRKFLEVVHVLYGGKRLFHSHYSVMDIVLGFFFDVCHYAGI